MYSKPNSFVEIGPVSLRLTIQPLTPAWNKTRRDINHIIKNMIYSFNAV